VIERFSLKHTGERVGSFLDGGPSRPAA